MKKDIIIGFASCLATAATLFVGSPANAEPIGDWVKTVNKQLDRKIAFPPDGRSGVVMATFERGENGRPTAVTVDSKDRALARAARITLSRLRQLPPLPEGYGARRIRMQMLVGNPADLAGYRAKRADLLASAEATNVRLARMSRPVQVATATAR